MTELLFITENANKVKTLSDILQDTGIHIKQQNIDLIEPQFDTIKEIAEYKAKKAFERIGKPLVVHDSGLTIQKLNNFPGPFTKYISDTIGNHGLIKLAADAEAYLEQTLVYVDLYGKLYVFSDKVPGKIKNMESLSTNKHDWGKIWEIFIPNGTNKTRAELSNEEYFTLRKSIQIGSIWDEFTKFIVQEYHNLNLKEPFQSH